MRTLEEIPTVLLHHQTIDCCVRQAFESEQVRPFLFDSQHVNAILVLLSPGFEPEQVRSVTLTLQAVSRLCNLDMTCRLELLFV